MDNSNVAAAMKCLSPDPKVALAEACVIVAILTNKIAPKTVLGYRPVLFSLSGNKKIEGKYSCTNVELEGPVRYHIECRESTEENP